MAKRKNIPGQQAFGAAYVSQGLTHADVIDGLVTVAWDESVIELVQQSNQIQIDIDRFVNSQSGMSVEGIRAAIFGDSSSVASSKVKAYQDYITRLVDGAINDAWGRGTAARQAENGTDVLYTWRIESAKPCPDCARRSGEERTLAEWEMVGLPRSGFSICGRNCKCIIDSQGKGGLNYKNPRKTKQA